MSARKLGGGRVLGSGKALAPPRPPQHQRTSDLISPSASTLSLSSGESSGLATSPLPDRSQDLSSVVSLQNGTTAVAAASSKLVCPICAEEMVSTLDCSLRFPFTDNMQMTLLQLNRYDLMREARAIETNQGQASG